MRNPYLKSMRWFLEKVPYEGCLMIFNGKKSSWHTIISKYFPDLTARVMNPYNFIENKYKDKNIRDLYITYKDEEKL